MLAEQVTAKIQIDANTQSGGDSVVEIVEMSRKIICIFRDEKNQIMYYVRAIEDGRITVSALKLIK